MSPLNSNMSWDPDCLRLDQRRDLGSQGRSRTGRQVSPIQGKFIAGPLDVAWLCKAKPLGATPLLVGLALWYLKGLRKTNTFIVSNILMKEWGVSPDAKSRALRKLEEAGLIAIERRGKRSPQISLLVVGGRSKGDKVAPSYPTSEHLQN